MAKKASLLKNCNDYLGHIDQIRLLSTKLLNDTVYYSKLEKYEIIQGILLRLCAYWEWFVEEHLVDLVNQDPGPMLKSLFQLDKMIHFEKKLCGALLYGHKYKDFRSTSELIGFTKKVIPEKLNPFVFLNTTEPKILEKIDFVYKIRNYLSHYSNYAQRSYFAALKKLLNKQNCVEPGQFLCSNKGKELFEIISAFQIAGEKCRDHALTNNVKKSA